MDRLKQLAEKIVNCNKLLVFTGAGISAASGVPTFRDPGGLWDKYSPEELANEEAFRRDPELVWSWYQWRRGLIKECSPNPGHTAIAQLESMVPEFLLVTQNVDGLHQAAGSKNIRCLHGDIFVNRCLDCKNITSRDLLDKEKPVKCEQCDSLYRPGVVWFGESLDSETLNHAWKSAENCDLFLSVGTAANVQPAAVLISVAKQAGAYVVEINPGGSQATEIVDLAFDQASEEVLPALLDLISADFKNI